MDDGIRKWIEGCIGTGEILRVVYLGGSHPGSVRDIVPLNVFEDGAKVWAYDVNAQGKKVRKCFSLEKIRRAEEGAVVDEVPYQPPEPTYASMDELEAAVRALVEPRGWGVMRDGDNIRVHRCTKRGDRLLKHPSFVLEYSDMVRDDVCYYDPDIDEFVEPPLHKTNRPWLTDKRRFKHFEKAAQAFIKQLQ